MVATLSSSLELSDETLLARHAAGDRLALEELFGRHRLIAYRVAFRFLGNEQDSLDAVQEGFIKALTNLPRFLMRSSFKTWLLRVVSNTALDMSRKRSRQATTKKEFPPSRSWDDIYCHDDPARGMEREDARRLLDLALASLSERHRKTFVLHEEGRLNYREVADATGVSIGTVMSRLYYARRKLREFLAPLVLQ